jgi:hypothetical protein
MGFLKMFRDSILLIILFFILCVVEHSISAGGLVPQTDNREELKSHENPNCSASVFDSESGSAGETQICSLLDGGNGPGIFEKLHCFLKEEGNSCSHEMEGVIAWSKKCSEFVLGAQKMLSEKESKMEEDKNNTPIIEDKIRYDIFKNDEHMGLSFYLHELKNWKGYGTKYLLLVLSAAGKKDVLTTSLISPDLLRDDRGRDRDYDLRAEFKPTVNEKYHLPILRSLMEDNVISGFKKLNEQGPEPVYLLMCRLGYDIYGINNVETAARQSPIKSVCH